MTFICRTNNKISRRAAEAAGTRRSCPTDETIRKKEPQGKRPGLFARSAVVFILLIAMSLSWDRAIAQRLIDLTYTFDETTQVWPSNLPFHRDSMVRGGTKTEAWYATGQVALSEHAGTHMDAPVHFAKGQVGIDDISVERLLSPAVVIDVRAAVANDRDYRLLWKTFSVGKPDMGPYRAARWS